MKVNTQISFKLQILLLILGVYAGLCSSICTAGTIHFGGSNTPSNQWTVIGNFGAGNNSVVQGGNESAMRQFCNQSGSGAALNPLRESLSMLNLAVCGEPARGTRPSNLNHIFLIDDRSGSYQEGLEELVENTGGRRMMPPAFRQHAQYGGILMIGAAYGSHISSRQSTTRWQQLVQRVARGGRAGQIASNEADGDDITRRYQDVPCTEWDSFLGRIQELVSQQVMSRTRGSDGEPVRREIGLTQDNESLRQVYDAARDAQAEDLRGGFDIFTDVTAVYHYENGRVERITFRSDHVDEEETEVSSQPVGRVATVEFGVGEFSSHELVSEDPNVMTVVAQRFEDQFLHIAGNHVYIRDRGIDGINNLPEDFQEQIYLELQGLSLPEDNLPIMVSTTVRVNVGEQNEEWNIRVTDMTHALNTSSTDRPSAGPDTRDVQRRQARDEALTSAVVSLIIDLTGHNPLGAWVSAGQQTYALIEHNMEYLRFAYRAGFWDGISAPVPGPAPFRRLHSSSDATLPQGHQRRVWIEEHYSNGYDEGFGVRDIVHNTYWEEILERMDRFTEQQRNVIRHLNEPPNLRERERFIFSCLQQHYRTEEQRTILLDSISR